MIPKKTYLISFLCLVVLPSVIYLLPFILGEFVDPSLYKDTWGFFGFPVMKPIFADLRGVTAPLECFKEHGLSIYENNPCDPWGRPYNYPRAWLALSYLGLNQSHTVLIGFFLAGVFLLSVGYLASLAGKRGVLMMLPALISPPVALLLERGNNDIVIFLLLVSSLLFGSITILLAAVLKLYPCFSFVGTLRERSPRTLFSFLTTVSVFAIYLYLFREDLARIDNSTASPTTLAYGGMILIPKHYQSYTQYVLVALFSLSSLLGYRFLANIIWIKEIPSQIATLFQYGSTIFLGTFFIDNNYNYRLVFLLLCIPFFVMLTKNSRGRYLGYFGYLGVVSQLWLENFPHTKALFLDEWANWIMFCLLSFITVGIFSSEFLGEKNK